MPGKGNGRHCQNAKFVQILASCLGQPKRKREAERSREETELTSGLRGGNSIMFRPSFLNVSSFKAYGSA
jgi:hypothetical protein